MSTPQVATRHYYGAAFAAGAQIIDGNRGLGGNFIVIDSITASLAGSSAGHVSFTITGVDPGSNTVTLYADGATVATADLTSVVARHFEGGFPLVNLAGQECHSIAVVNGSGTTGTYSINYHYRTWNV